MTQPPPPHDPYQGQVRPVQPQQFDQRFGGQFPGFPGQMRGVDQYTTSVPRPGAVVAAFALWLLAALSWPLGTVVRALAEGDALTGFGPVMTLFGTSCLAVGGVWGAVAFLRGGYQARLGLCGGALVTGFLTVGAVVLAARDGAEPLSWVVIVLRLVLPAVAAVLSFLPGTRAYFAGNLG
ncbi:hypothetical protein JOF41_005693 [Saccharothrix coeruleofusca]|uniref:hypothetical protein n=1 Tax=Saccharothrix coeruleofusca TaxID=33919 RepID=UPI001AEADD98|nr:hypothetical protein [Saccharothrix coeruleofusca]MBP2339515.1 hypothetical protein [Saccharothrix coeruleofusca]